MKLSVIIFLVVRVFSLLRPIFQNEEKHNRLFKFYGLHQYFKILLTNDLGFILWSHVVHSQK